MYQNIFCLVNDPPHFSEQDELIAPLIVDLHVEVIVIIGGVVNAANGSVARSFKKSPASVFDRPTVLAGKESQRS